MMHFGDLPAKADLKDFEHVEHLHALGAFENPDSHHAIFTHHTTNMHIHVKTGDNKITGHVDGFTLGQAMILKLPDTE